MEVLSRQNFLSRAMIPGVWIPRIAYPSVTDRTPVVYQSPKVIPIVIPG